MSRKRNVNLEAELSDDPESFDADDLPEPAAAAPLEAAVPEALAAPAAPAPALDPSMAALVQALAQAIQGGQVQQQDAFAALLKNNAAAVAQIAREKMPENSNDPGVSVFNPYGDRDFPRPALQGKLYIAQQHPDTMAFERLYEEEADALDYDTRLFVNALPHGLSGLVTLSDDRRVPVSVHVISNGAGVVQQRLICVPYSMLSKDNKAEKNAWVGVKKAAMQLLGETRVAELRAADAAARAAKVAAQAA